MRVRLTMIAITMMVLALSSPAAAQAPGPPYQPPVNPIPHKVDCKDDTVVVTQDAQKKKVMTKATCPSTQWHQSPQGEPASALLWTMNNVVLTMYEDVPFIRMKFNGAMKWGFGGRYYIVVVGYQANGQVRNRWALEKMSPGPPHPNSPDRWEFSPQCGEHNKEQIWERTIDITEFNDIVNFGWGFLIVDPAGTQWTQC